MFRRALAVLRSLAGTGRPDDLDALIVAREPQPYPLTRAALANLRDTLTDWHDEVWALADVELAEMTQEGDAPC